MTLPDLDAERKRKRKKRILIGLWVGVFALAFLFPLVLNLPVYAHKRAGPIRIQKVLDEQAAAWNRGDLEGFMQGYWNSDELEFASGDKVTRGWQPTLERYRKRYQTEGKEMGHLDFTDIQIGMNSDTEATVTGRWRLTLKDSNPGGGFTLTFRRFESEWKIVKDVTTSDPKSNP